MVSIGVKYAWLICICWRNVLSLSGMHTTQHKPNIIFVVLDTHRLDRLGCYGYSRETSPNLDAFARQATVFENAISPAQWTIPSHASMFSGEPPTTHVALQSGDVLGPRFKTLAEHLRSNGYQTIGFCNNPLVGVINNGFRRGFETFYNYGGAIPSIPAKSSKRLFAPFNRAWEFYTQLLRKIAYPIQNAFANSSRIFQAALNPFWVPLWTRFARFKGDTPGSIRDVAHFVRQQAEAGDGQPYFLFFNLMETHLPFSTPERFVRAFAPRVREDRAVRDFVRAFNTRAAEWIMPVDEPFPELEAQTLSDMYDAEVAYQDHLLAELLAALDHPEQRANTLVVFVADHGEMLGEHQLMGHAFGVYQELIHVPLLIRFPGQASGRRVEEPVSTTRLFHTVLELAGVEAYETVYSPVVDVKSQSLTREAYGAGRAQPVVFSEAYAPDYAIQVMENHRPDLIERFNCRATHWAVYEGRCKLIRVHDVLDRLFLLDADPLELHTALAGAEAERMGQLVGQLGSYLEKASARRPKHGTRAKADLENEIVRRRLRDLGYIE
jgi:arylsulfatase A-like enzyme